MAEPGSGEKPGLIASLKAAFAKWTGATPKIASDGEISSAPSGLEKGQGINQRPDLPSGQSGGGTNPNVDPKEDTT